LGSALASSDVKASSRNQAMRSALIAASWAQAVLIAKSREGNRPKPVAQHVDVADRLTAIGQHHRDVDQDLAPVMDRQERTPRGGLR